MSSEEKRNQGSEKLLELRIEIRFRSKGKINRTNENKIIFMMAKTVKIR